MACSNVSSSVPPPPASVAPSAPDAGVNSAPPTLSPGMTIVFDSEHESEDVLTYNEVKFYVRFDRLKGSLKDRLEQRSSELVLPELQYVSIVPDDSDGVDEKDFDYAPPQRQQQPDDDSDDDEKKQYSVLGKRFVLKVDNKVDAMDILLLLATMYWHDRPEQLFFDRSSLVLQPFKDEDGNIVPNKHLALKVCFKSVSVYIPPPWSTSQPFFCWWYAGIALLHKYECRDMIANIFRLVGTRYLPLQMPNLLSTFIVCLWLVETYGGMQHADTATKFRDEVKSMQNVADSLHLLPAGVVSKEIYHWLLLRWIARSRLAEERRKAHQTVLTDYVERDIKRRRMRN